jgi:hypothetical protein
MSFDIETLLLVLVIFLIVCLLLTNGGRLRSERASFSFWGVVILGIQFLTIVQALGGNHSFGDGPYRSQAGLGASGRGEFIYVLDWMIVRVVRNPSHAFPGLCVLTLYGVIARYLVPPRQM